MKVENLQTKSVGLVLSGGGVRGMAHIGVIRAMQEHDISSDLISGSSVGALVAALYANGNSVADMISFFKETPLFRKAKACSNGNKSAKRGRGVLL